MVFLFDAANTLIYKPAFFPAFTRVLQEYGYRLNTEELSRVHKHLSEVYTFPDRTDTAFYHRFNADVLIAMGVIPTDEMLENVFKACSYLPWQRFDDTAILIELPVRKAIISNFHSGLTKIVADFFPGTFDEIIISENEKHRKPDLEFYQYAIEKLGVPPTEIIYVGDSIKLDMIPAMKTGINSWLIDRQNHYPAYKQKLSSLHELFKFVSR